MSARPRTMAVLVLLALAPVLAFFADRGELSVALSALCVVVIAASVFWMLGPHETGADADIDTGAGV